MIVHVAFEVSDLARSATFYDAIFHALGARRTFESDRAVAYGRDKLQRKGLDAVVVNDIARADIGFDAPENEVTIVTAEGEHRHAAYVEMAPDANPAVHDDAAGEQHQGLLVQRAVEEHSCRLEHQHPCRQARGARPGQLADG